MRGKTPSLTSKLAIGTVQFGMAYGISNQEGQTRNEEVTSILSTAQQAGIPLLDTAYGYGTSEAVLGNHNIDSFKIVSKFPKLAEDEKISTFLKRSLERLGQSQVYGYLAHHAGLLLQRPELWEELCALKRQGKVKKIGYSLYEPTELYALLNAGLSPDLIQVPFNYLDRRFEADLQRLSSEGVEIHSRSTFLQGLFFMDPSTLPDHFDDLKPFLYELSSQFPENAKRAAFLLNFCLRQPFIDHVIIGINNSQQLHTNLLALQATFPTPILSSASVSEDILLPFLWPKLTI